MATIPQGESQIETSTSDLSLTANRQSNSQVILERISQGRRVSVDGIDVSNDTISEVIGALKFLAADEAVKANGGGFSALKREKAVPPSTNGGFRYRFANAHNYRYPRWY